MTTLSIPIPELFNTESGDIDIWISEIENYILAAFGDFPHGRKKAILIATIGNAARLAINNFQEDQKDTYDHLVDALKEHYKEVTNVIVERHIFYTMTQEQEETIEAYETRLTTQAKKCNFSVPSIEVPAVPARDNQPAIPAVPVQYKDVSEEMIRDRIVVGIQNKSIQRRLLRERDLTLRSAVDMLKSIEVANQQAKTYGLANNSTANIDAVKQKKFKTRNPETSANNKPQISKRREPKQQPCKYC